MIFHPQATLIYAASKTGTAFVKIIIYLRSFVKFVDKA
jgi:hypothetical protein